MKWLVLVLVSVALVFSCGCNIGNKESSDTATDPTGGTERVFVTLIADSLHDGVSVNFKAVPINGQGPFIFTLDTGNGDTVERVGNALNEVYVYDSCGLGESTSGFPATLTVLDANNWGGGDSATARPCD